MQKDLDSSIDGNRRDGILAEQKRGTFAHVTIRIPLRRAGELRRFLEGAYADEPIATLYTVKAALRKVARQLRALGITRVYVFGSVARGEAAAASDVDLAYCVRNDLTCERWIAANDLFERILEKVVDAHRVSGPADLPPDAIQVWPAAFRVTGPPQRST